MSPASTAGGQRLPQPQIRGPQGHFGTRKTPARAEALPGCRCPTWTQESIRRRPFDESFPNGSGLPIRAASGRFSRPVLRTDCCVLTRGSRSRPVITEDRSAPAFPVREPEEGDHPLLPAWARPRWRAQDRTLTSGLNPRGGGPTADWRWPGPAWRCPPGPGCCTARSSCFRRRRSRP